MKSKKAPGPDDISAEVYKLVFQHRPDLLLDAFNACLKEDIFPARWKVARLPLIHKGKGDPGSSVLEPGDPQSMLPCKSWTPFDEQRHITELDGWCSS